MNDTTLPTLTAMQVRVLACLMEKHLATPNNYPLTPNALTLACNQKTNRLPVVSLEEGKVVQLAQQLNELNLVSIDYGERINKFSHRAPGKFGITREQQAVLAILMLREPLTLNEIKARTEKMVGFASNQEVKEVIEQLLDRSPPLLIELPVVIGQREGRYTHLLAGEPDLSAMPAKSPVRSGIKFDQRLAELEARIERLEAALDLSDK